MSEFTIALDCMGGDKAPQIVIEGADIVASKHANINFLLFGDSKKVLPIINHCRHLKGRFDFIHTDEFVSSSEKPSVALRKLTKSSMRLAIDAVKEKRAMAVVSAGNTGALMAIAKLVLRTLPTISRPAIVTSVPNKKNKGTVLLDMGANIECDANLLFEFAIMGKAFANYALNIANPKIGVLNVGSEELKGNNHVQNVANMLKNSTMASNFCGYVEGDDIVKGEVDVVVTDGFTGNVALKTIEGTAKFISSVIKDGFTSSWLAKIGYILSSVSLNNAIKKIDPRMHNGAMLIGLNGIAVKSHGSTDAVGFANAIMVANNLIVNKINEKIIADLNQNKDCLNDFHQVQSINQTN